jgi:hypothetical protein
MEENRKAAQLPEGAEHKLGYAQSGAERPADTRILVDELPGSTRYTDPPGSRSVAFFRVLAAVCGAVSVASITTVLFLAASRTGFWKQGIGVTVVALMFAMIARGFIDSSRSFALRPVIIEVGKSGLRLNDPAKGTFLWTRDQVSSIGYTSWLSIPGVKPDGFGGLLIRADGKQFQILHGRPIAEINWLSGQLLNRLGIDTNEKT